MSPETDTHDIDRPHDRAPHRSASPTVAQSVEMYLDDCRANNLRPKTVRTYRSVLWGSDALSGRPGRGTPLARSHLGRRAVRGVKAPEIVKWFLLKTADVGTHSTRNQAAPMNGWLSYCERNGWMTEATVKAARRNGLARGESDRRWLHPEQVSELEKVIHRSRFDDYERMLWEVLLSTGVRTSEVRPMKVSHLSPRELSLHIPAGKGRGDGKARDIPVDRSLVESWMAHARRFNLGPSHHVFFHREKELTGGADPSADWTWDTSRPTSDSSVRTFVARVREEAVCAVSDHTFDPMLLPEWDIEPKVLRKTYACTQLILAKLNLGGLTLPELQDALGHESLSTTQTYLADVERYLGTLNQPVGTQDAAKLIIQAKQDLDQAA